MRENMQCIHPQNTEVIEIVCELFYIPCEFINVKFVYFCIFPPKLSISHTEIIYEGI